MDIRTLLASGAAAPAALESAISVRGLGCTYGTQRALHGVTLDVPRHCVTAFIGPSGCGKSTFLRCLNRMNDLVSGCRVEGSVLVGERDIYASEMDPVALRREVGMVFQKPNPFPVSVYDNVAYGPRIHGIRAKGELDGIVRRALEQAALWDEVRDKLSSRATQLSGGQQQRLCIARALAVEPKVLLMDEPCSALDPIATARIEDLLLELKQDYTIILVTHNMQQAQRASDFTAFFLAGELIEFDWTQNIFVHPRERRTEDYISGRFG